MSISVSLASFLLTALLSAADADTAPTQLAAEASSQPLAPTAETSPTSPPAETAFSDVTDFNELDLEALLDAKVETASKKSESTSKAPAIIEVMTRRQLYDLGARDLYTALTFLPGIELIESFAGITLLVFRGNMQEQYNVKLLVLINGHPLLEGISSQFELEAIPLEAINRVELIRGPGSVLYGTNAFAGVINIITESRKEDGLDSIARLQGGQFSTYSGGGGNTGRYGDLAWSVYTNAQKTRGYPYRIRKDQNEDCVDEIVLGTPPPRPYDCARPGTYSGILDYYNNYVNGYADLKFKGLRVQGGALGQQRQKYGFIPILRLHGDNEVMHSFGDVSYRYDWDTFNIMARAGLNHDTRTWNIGVFPYPSGFEETHADIESNNYRAELTASWTIIDDLVLDQGLSVEQADLDRAMFLYPNGKLHPVAPKFEDLSQSTASWYGQGTYAITEELTAIAGFRLSQFKTDRTQVNLGASNIATYVKAVEPAVLLKSPRGGLVYSPLDRLTFKILYGEAFRFPNLWEENATMTQLVVVSPGIKPETIQTGELGVDSRPLEWLNARANVFYSAEQNIIERRTNLSAHEHLQLGGGTAGSVYDNVFKATTVGVEVSTQAIVSDKWTFFANAGWKQRKLDPYLAFEDVGLLRRPRAAPLTANAGTSYKAMSWLVLRPNGQYIGPRGYTPSHVLANAVVDFPVTDEVTLSLIGDNLLDTQYDYPDLVRRHVKTIPGGPGRAFYGRAVAQF